MMEPIKQRVYVGDKKIEFVKNVTESMTIEEFLKQGLLHYAVDSGNKQMFEDLHEGKYKVIIDDVDMVMQAKEEMAAAEDEVNNYVKNQIGGYDEVYYQKVAAKIYMENVNFEAADEHLLELLKVQDISNTEYWILYEMLQKLF